MHTRPLVANRLGRTTAQPKPPPEVPRLPTPPPDRRRQALFVLLGLALLTVAFTGGGVAHRKCWFPFCGGYHQLLTPETLGGGQPPAVLLPSSRYTLRVEEVAVPGGAYGLAAMDEWGDGWVVADKEGLLYRVAPDRSVSRLPVTVPFSRRSFDAVVTARSPAYWFAVKDIRVVPMPEGDAWLVASYHHWDPDRQCTSLRVASTSLYGNVEDGWVQLFESTPCLPFKSKGWTFGGHQAGGRIEILSPTELLVSVGDQEFDGSHGPNFPQNRATSYGKTWRIDLTTRTAQIFTLGHRNPQGLHRASDGTLWGTEHGPTGGDELNQLTEGSNYGWPHVTYGVAGEYTRTQGAHSGYTLPRYAWVPSIGVSQVIRVQGSRFPRWRGDLLVASLRAETLFRVHMEGDRVAFVEPIKIDERIRDMMETRDGSLVLVTEKPALLVLHPTPIGTL